VKQERTFCRFCLALCGVVITTDGDRVVDVQGDRDDPLSRGYACEKGRSLGAWHHHPQRLDRPQMRVEGELRPSTWEPVLDDLGARLNQIVAESGPDSIAAYAATGSVFDASGARLVRRWLAGLGSRSLYTSGSIDAPAKALVAEILTGRHWLVPTMDYERATLFLFIGTNPVVSHGHFNGLTNPVDLLRRARGRGEVWVLDPRSTETARLASRHLAPAPGTDFAILAHIVRELLREGADRAFLDAHAEGVAELAAALEPWNAAQTAGVSGVSLADLADLVAAVRRHGRLAAQTGTGITMSDEANVAEWLVWCLHAVTGSFERPGGVWFNPGYLRQLDLRDWAAGPRPPDPAEPMPSRPDLPRRFGESPTAALADEILAGNIRALVLAGGNPMRSVPDPRRMKEALSRLEVLVLADVRELEVMEEVTHVLPLAGQLERADLSHWVDQFLPQTAGRYTPAVLAPQAERRPMWWVFAALGERMDLRLLAADLELGTATDDDLLRPLAERGRGGSFEKLRDGRVEVAEPNFGWVAARLLPAGRYRLWQPELGAQLAALARPPEGGLRLLPRRQRRHLNSQMPEFQSGPGLHDRPDLLINPDDAAVRGLAEGTAVVVRSARGELQSRVKLDRGLARGAVSLPHGWKEVNVEALLTTEGADPLTGMPRMSGVEVEVEALALSLGEDG
jgi:anaerobic selenocysteine-containing dehydrogenase